jgi:hypothetical protein
MATRSIKYGLGIPLLLALALLAGCDDSAKEATWLHGTWTLAYNPGHDSDDSLTFTPDGTVSIATPDARHFKARYRLKDQTLSMLIDGKEGVTSVPFEISPDHARLTYETGAYYTRKTAAAPE